MNFRDRMQVVDHGVRDAEKAVYAQEPRAAGSAAKEPDLS